MHWQEAVLESKVGRAIRILSDGRTMVRYNGGEGFVQMRGGGVFRQTKQEELEGHEDWKPATAEMNPNII